MNKRLLLVLLVLAFLPFKMKAEWVTLYKNKTAQTPPKVQILSDDNSGTILKIEIAGFDIRQFTTDGKSYQVVDLLSDIFVTNPGSPELPHIAKILAVPDQAGISVEVIETGEIQTFQNIYLPPARQSWWEGQPETAYEENSKAYNSDEIFPNEFASTEAPSVFRDFRIARVSVFPLRYNAAKRELQAVSSITVRVNYGKGEVINPKTSPKHKIAPSFAKLYRSFIFNYQSVLDNRYDGREDGRELMLCIMPDIFPAGFQVYADWKRQSGTDIHVTKFSDIGANATNPDIIKTHIADAYHNWENPPTYVLIIGDDGVFPKKIITYPDYSFPSDDYFVEIDGDDYFPEMMIGRFTNQGDTRMQIMINKFLLYEKNPYTADTDWFKKATCCSNNEYQSQVDTKTFVSEVLLQSGGFSSVDLMMSDGNSWGGGCSYNLNDIVDVINEGRGYLNYRGEGWYYGWYANCYDFPTDEVSNLNNGQKFTFVTSIGCGVAMFDCPGGNSFGEEWVEMGSLTSPKGACAFVGPTSNTHTTYNNRIDKGIYVGMFQEGMDTPGQALLRGKMYMYNVFGNDYYTQYHFKVFHVLGDPSIHIWKEVPTAITVEYPATILVGNDQVEVTVKFASSGQPVPDAEVCLTGSELFATGMTDATGKVTINITPEILETLKVTVRGKWVIPIQGDLEVIEILELIEPEGLPVIVDIDGNTDGLINPNEHCNFTITLKNWGTQTANNIQATLSTPNTNYVEIITASPVNFGNIASGNTTTGNPFQFFVKPNCPIGQIITLNLHVTSSNTAWDYEFTAEVMGCELHYDNFVVYDADEPDMNFRMDPGETVVLVVSVENTGADIAPNVMGILSSNDPYITIPDSIGTFGTLAINGSATNTDFNFMVSVAPNCPVGYMADYSLKLYTQNGNYPYQFIDNLEIPVGLPISTDYSGPDAYGYYAYSNDDTFYDETPVYDWKEISYFGSQITLPAMSDYTQTINIPFAFTYYGVSYNQIRVSTDGWMAFGSGTQTAPINNVLPSNDNVNNMVAVFWDDLLDSEFYMGKIFYSNDYINNRFIIEWDSISHNGFLSEPEREVFQAILLNPVHYPTATGDGEMIFQYKTVKNPESTTIGIENASQDVGLQYVFNNNYSATATSLVDNFALKFTTDPPFTTIITAIGDNQDGKNLNSDGFGLQQNHPNPFTSSTRIDYTLARSGHATLSIFNVNGELVRTLKNGNQAAGKYSVEWNGLNEAGNQVNSGIYFYRLQTNDFVGTMKMFLVR